MDEQDLHLLHTLERQVHAGSQLSPTETAKLVKLRDQNRLLHEPISPLPTHEPQQHEPPPSAPPSAPEFQFFLEQMEAKFEARLGSATAHLEQGFAEQMELLRRENEALRARTTRTQLHFDEDTPLQHDAATTADRSKLVPLHEADRDYSNVSARSLKHPVMDFARVVDQLPVVREFYATYGSKDGQLKISTHAGHLMHFEKSLDIGETTKKFRAARTKGDALISKVEEEFEAALRGLSCPEPLIALHSWSILSAAVTDQDSAKFAVDCADYITRVMRALARCFDYNALLRAVRKDQVMHTFSAETSELDPAVLKFFSPQNNSDYLVLFQDAHVIVRTALKTVLARTKPPRALMQYFYDIPKNATDIHTHYRDFINRYEAATLSMDGKDFEVEWRQVDLFIKSLSRPLQTEYKTAMKARSEAEGGALCEHETTWNDCTDLMQKIWRFVEDQSTRRRPEDHGAWCEIHASDTHTTDKCGALLAQLQITPNREVALAAAMDEWAAYRKRKQRNASQSEDQDQPTNPAYVPVKKTAAPAVAAPEEEEKTTPQVEERTTKIAAHAVLGLSQRPTHLKIDANGDPIDPPRPPVQTPEQAAAAYGTTIRR